MSEKGKFKLSSLTNVAHVAIIVVAFCFHDPYSRTALYALQIFMVLLALPAILLASIAKPESKPSKFNHAGSMFTDAMILIYFVSISSITFSVLQMFAWLCCETSYAAWGAGHSTFKEATESTQGESK
jgi:hypothetical protein